MLQLDAGIGGDAAPFDGFGTCVAVAAPSGRFGGHDLPFSEVAIETLPGQDTQFALGHVEPVAVGRGIVPFEVGRQAVCGGLVEGLVQGLGGMRVEVVADQAEKIGLGEVDLRQCPQDMGAVDGRAPVAYLDRPPAQQGAESRKRLQVPVRSYC